MAYWQYYLMLLKIVVFYVLFYYMPRLLHNQHDLHQSQLYQNFLHYISFFITSPYFPKQNFAKILFIISSETLSPVISPRCSKICLMFIATTSIGIFIFKSSMAILVLSIALLINS